MRPGVGGCWVGSMNVMVGIVLLAATYAECDDALALCVALATKYFRSTDIVHTMVTPFLVCGHDFLAMFVAPIPSATTLAISPLSEEARTDGNHKK
eukprot:scaffold2812_cov255-Skeletonema_marinoi.AAC.3